MCSTSQWHHCSNIKQNPASDSTHTVVRTEASDSTQAVTHAVARTGASDSPQAVACIETSESLQAVACTEASDSPHAVARTEASASPQAIFHKYCYSGVSRNGSNYQSTLRNIREERRCHFQQCESLKSRKSVGGQSVGMCVPTMDLRLYSQKKKNNTFEIIFTRW